MRQRRWHLLLAVCWPGFLLSLLFGCFCCMTLFCMRKLLPPPALHLFLLRTWASSSSRGCGLRKLHSLLIPFLRVCHASSRSSGWESWAQQGECNQTATGTKDWDSCHPNARAALPMMGWTTLLPPSAHSYVTGVHKGQLFWSPARWGLNRTGQGPNLTWVDWWLPSPDGLAGPGKTLCLLFY